MKFWQGKFNEGQSSEIKRYLSTYSFDKRLYKHDVMGSIAHCTMLGEQGIISAEEAAVLRNALTQIFYDITAGKLAADNEANVFDFLDGVLCEKVGEIGKKYRSHAIRQVRARYENVRRRRLRRNHERAEGSCRNANRHSRKKLFRYYAD